MIVILSNQDRYFSAWARQFVAHDRAGRDMVIVPNIQGRRISEVRRNIDAIYAPAIRRAGQGGTLIISVGHGGTGGSQCDGAACLVAADTSIGMVDLLPSEALRIQRSHVFYSREQQETDARVIAEADAIGSRQCQTLARRYPVTGRHPRPPPPPLARDYGVCLGAAGVRDRLEIRRAYDRIGELLRENHVAEVVFLTCRLGNSREFVNRIAADWGVTITAYLRRVAAVRDSEGMMRVYLHPDREGQGTNTVRAREEIPDRERYTTRPASSAAVAR
jgi:hypothetical protein